MSEDDDLDHLRGAIEVINKEKVATRDLIRRGDRATNRVVTCVGLLAAIIAIVAAGGPLFLLDWVVAILGIAGGTFGGAALYLQSRWTSRRALLDEELAEQEEQLLLFSNTASEIEGRNTALQLQGPEAMQILPARGKRRRRKRGKKGKKRQKNEITE